MKEKPITFRDKKTDLEDILQNRSPISLLLDGLEDIQNIGMLFRLADAARLKHLYLYNMPHFEITKKLERIARSTIKYVPYSKLNTHEEIAFLKKENDLIALEYTTLSIPFSDYKIEQDTLIIIGNERYGVSQELLNLSRQSIHIPMLGVHSSMNVAMATGIVVGNFLFQK